VIEFLRRNRATIALVLLLVIGAIIAQVAADRDASQRGEAVLSSRDASPRGSLALALWLERLGYRVSQLAGAVSTPDDTIRYLFVLRPTTRLTQTEARAIVNWVRRGGTLVYVPSLIPTFGATGVDVGDGLGSELDVALQVASGASTATPRSAAPVLPFFTSPAGSSFVVADTGALTLGADAWVPLLQVPTAGPAQIVAAERRYGAGRAYAVASAGFFDNAHLANADNAALVLNLLARGAEERVVAFDEYHHGEIAATDLASVVRASPWGWAMIYATLVTLLFGLWSGRRFGPPLARESLPGRSAADYVTSFAGLLQRSPGSRGAAVAWAQAQYARLVRRELARAHGIRADLPAGDLASRLAERRPIDPTALAEHLTALDGPPLGQRQLLAELRQLEPILRTLVPLSSDQDRRS
jgi:Domain of unknown function (DUF4350)